MANGDYWNRGGRQQGMRTNTAMDTIERILGMGRGIAEGVQAQRNRRDASQAQWLGALTQGFDSNYSAISIQNMSDKIK